MSIASTQSAGLPDEHDAVIVSQFVALIHAKRKGDYLTATDARQNLQRLGICVRFVRQQKGGSLD